jgi:hypothetical protein
LFIRQILTKKSPFSINMSYNNQILNLTLLNETNQIYENVHLIVTLFEYDVYYEGKNGQKKHKNIVRDYINYENGKIVNLSSNQPIEQTLFIDYKMDPKKLYYIVCMLQDGDSKEIYQSERIKVNSQTFLFLTVGNSLAYVDDLEHRFDAPPILINGRTMVPLRFISETLGATVKFIPYPTNEVQISFRNTFIHLWISSINAKIEYPPETEKKSIPMNLDSPPIIIKGRTVVPLRFIGEVFGASIDWEPKTQVITLILELNQE